jgi:hypothetical protein
LWTLWVIWCVLIYIDANIIVMKLQTIASKLLQSSANDSDGNAINPIDARLKGLNLKSIEPIARSSKEFMALEKYAKDSHGVTHGHLNKATVQDIFKIERSVRLRSPVFVR